MVKITLDKERHLRLSLKGMLEYENVTGINLFKGFDIQKMTFKQVAALMWACLIHEDKELTFDNFLDIVDLSNITAMKEAVIECINESLPDIKEKTHPLAKKRS